MNKMFSLTIDVGSFVFKHRECPFHDHAGDQAVLELLYK